MTDCETASHWVDHTRLFVGHDYCKDGVDEAEYVKLRTERDRTLLLPDRCLCALQVNLRGGRLPEPESDGRSYFQGSGQQILRALPPTTPVRLTA